MPPQFFALFLLGLLLTTDVSAAAAAAAAAPGRPGSTYALAYGEPRQLGVDPAKLAHIDTIVGEAIGQKLFPGAVVLALRDGQIVFERAYGHHRFDGEPVRLTDLFDVASLTKVAATTLAVMRLVERGQLRLDDPVGAYLGELCDTHPDKAELRLRDLLTHQAGLAPALTFYAEAAARAAAVGGPEAVEVAHRYYVPSAFYAEVMWPKMLDSRLQSPGRYLYSDIGMYMIKEIVERVTGQHLDAYVEAQFYRPLGASSAGFLPRQRFPQARIVPSENDTFFRHQLLCGYVHDPGAALAGGVSCHAGLFASAYDLAIIGQMLLNGGHYGGQWHLHPDTVAAFSARQGEASRRGLGFDRCDPALDGGYPSRLASPEVFGHTGFTGTALWVDPRQRLVFVFLSNRLLSPTPRAFLRQNVRPRVLDALYEALAAP